MDKKHNTSPSHRSLGTQNVILFFYYFNILFFFPIPIRAGGKFEIYTVRIVSKKDMQNCDCKFIAFYYYLTLPTSAHFCTFIYLYFISFFSAFLLQTNSGNVTSSSLLQLGAFSLRIFSVKYTSEEYLRN